MILMYPSYLGLHLFLFALGGTGAQSPVSKCGQGLFQCSSGTVHCLNQSQVCDFSSQCDDGSDERECGSCSFEVDECGWQDESVGNLMWSIVNVNNSAESLEDHSLQKPGQGQCLCVGAGSGDNELPALFVGPTLLATGAACSMSVYYYLESLLTNGNVIFGIRNGTDASKIVITSTAIELVSIRPASQWMHYSYHIGALPAGFQIFISAENTYSEMKESATVCIDDINFENCQDGVLSNISSLNCDFEDDWCGHFNDYTQDLEWIRAKKDTTVVPAGLDRDHTTGSGYFIFVDLKQTLTQKEVKARLATGILEPQVMKSACLSFFYNIYETMSYLNVYQAEKNDKKLIFSQSYSSNSWQLGLAPVRPIEEYQIVFEATVMTTSFYGHIAVDDISFIPSPCPVSTFCSFEYGFCGYEQSTTDQLDWTLTSGENATKMEAKNSSFNPTADHTSSNQYGHYIKMSVVGHKVGEKADLISPEFPGVPGPMCLTFWYFIDTNKTSSLEIYYQPVSNFVLDAISVWKNMGTGHFWQYAQQTLQTNSNFRLVFQSTVPSGATTDVCVDDILVQFGECPMQGSCNFENDVCGFNFYDQYTWFRNRWQPGSLLPPVDHSTGSSTGYYISFNSTGHPQGSKVYILSPWLPASDEMCLSFWYFSYGYNGQTLGLNILTGVTGGFNDTESIYQGQRIQGSEWINVMLNFSMTQPFQYIIECEVNGSQGGGMALDDLVLHSGSCTDWTTQTVAPQEFIKYPPTKLDCSFNTLCNWTQDRTDNFDWLITSKTSFSFTGRAYDHTLETEEGSFIMPYPANLTEGDYARLLSPPLENLSQGICLKFWYLMSGPIIGTLNVRLLKDDDDKVILWERQGEQGEDWFFAQVYASPADLTPGHPKVVKFIIENMVVGELQEDIRIDDITSNLGPCTEDIRNCDFENPDLCGFTQDPFDNGDWILNSGTNLSSTSAPLSDHTYGTDLGHYLYTEGSQSFSKSKAGIMSPMMGPAKAKCLQFYFHMFGEDAGALTVKILNQEGDITEIWTHEGPAGDGWKGSQADVISDVNFQIIFEGILPENSAGIIAIDDIRLLDSACWEPATCDFEEGMCLYQNVKNGDEFDWLRNRGTILSQSSGPSRDDTTNTTKGYYIYTYGAPSRVGQTARLISGMLPQTDGSCLSFAYNQRGLGDMILVQDFINSGSMMYPFFFQEDTGGQWEQKFYNITADGEFSLIFESQIGPDGYTSLDDISYTQGFCTDAEEAEEFTCPEDGLVIPLVKRCNFIRDCSNGTDELNCGNCNFEAGLCRYMDTSRGVFHWVRASNSTMSKSAHTQSLGYDHTLYSPKGYMLYVDHSQGRAGSQAVLQSPLLHGSYQACTLQFYYKFSSYRSGDISVALKFEQTSTYATSFHQNKVYNIDSWHLAQVDIGYIDEGFHLLIMASKSFTAQGTVAVDDVRLINCEPPKGTSLGCDDNMFRCSSGFCVNSKVVCDLSDDCGDGSDEVNCSYTSSCDFEMSMCVWEQDQHAQVTWKLGSGMTRDLPLARDHTTGMSGGHFLYLGNTAGAPGSRARITSSTIQPISSGPSCQLTLYYNMFNLDDGASLNVYLRTTSGGYETLLFTRQNPETDAWERSVIPLVSSKDFQVVVEGVQGTTFNRDAVVAIDDVVLSHGCKFTPSTLPTPGYTRTTQRVTPNSCLSDHQCPDGQCIPRDFICDMQMDCSDGSDEASCGPCEFETGMCGYYSTSIGSLDWSISSTDLMGKVGPAGDNTFKASSGHYSYVNPVLGLSRSPALLSSGPLPGISSSCTVTLAQHTNPAISGNLTLYAYYQETQTQLVLKGTEDTTSPDWQSSTYGFINITVDKGWQLMIGFQTDQEIAYHDIAAIDSIRFNSCSKREEVINLNCNFDNHNLCSWRQSHKDVFDWAFSKTSDPTPNGPKRDHSDSGSGFYLLASSQARANNDSAILVSPPMPATVTDYCCLSFWYYMNGPDVGELRVESYEQDNVIDVDFDRTGSLPNHWIQALAQVRTFTTFTLGIKAIVTGGHMGDISIDYIEYTQGPCVAPNECMFEDNDFCQWTQDSSDTIYWIMASNTTVAGSSPNTDHTLGTPDGHFANLQTSPTGTATLGRSLQQSNGSHTTICFQLWYNMMSAPPAELVVYAKYQGGEAQNLLKIQGTSENIWRKASINIYPPPGEYELKIKASVHGGQGHVTLDDLLLEDGGCPAPGTCNFNEDLCSFVTIPNNNHFEWVLHSDNPRGTFPDSFLIAQSSNSTELGETAVLLSEIIVYDPNATSVKCLQYSAQLRSPGTGLGSKPLNIYSRNVFTNGKTLMSVVDTFVKNQWSTFLVEFQVEGDFDFTFEVIHDGHSDSSLAVDDVHLQNYPCGYSTVLSTPAPQSTSQMYPPSPLGCSFEIDLCQWKALLNSASEGWQIRRHFLIAPASDHTYDSINGGYAADIRNSSGRVKTAYLFSPSIFMGGKLCLKFWFFMYGSDVGNLSVAVNSETVYWFRQGSQGPEWKFAMVHIGGVSGSGVISFESSSTQGGAAIDDVSTNQGECPPSDFCDFENDICGYYNDPLGYFPWTRATALSFNNNSGAIRGDHTTGSPEGHFLFFNTTDRQQGDAAHVTTTDLMTSSAACLTFWYLMRGVNANRFYVYLKDMGTNMQSSEPSFSKTGSQGNVWQLGSVSIGEAGNFRASFEAVAGAGPLSQMALDDIRLVAGKCPGFGTCDFEDELCSWYNTEDGDRLDWIRRLGTDHTTNTMHGVYMAVTGASAGDNAYLISPNLNKVTTYCLSLWTKPDVGNHLINLYTRNVDGTDLQAHKQDSIDLRSTIQNGRWELFQRTLKYFSFDVGEYQLVLEAVKGSSNGDIYLDDISLQVGNCSLLPPPLQRYKSYYCNSSQTWIGSSQVCDFTTDCPGDNEEVNCGYDCDFEDGACLWKNVDVADWIQVIGTSAAGVMQVNDHTLGTTNGHFLTIKKLPSASAAYESPLLQQSSPTCVLSFSCYMDTTVEDIMLTVSLQEGAHTSVVSSKHNGIGSWENVIILIGRMSRPFKVKIQTVMQEDIEGRIFIDDIAFTSCALPRSTDCNPFDKNQIACNNTACIDRSGLCNFQDDCGDNSDESPQYCRGFRMCDFESDTCYWAQETGTDDFDWYVDSASRFSSVLTDHSTNGPSGHFLTTMSHTGHAQNKACLLSPTFKPSSKCSFRFSYFIDDLALGSLQVHVRYAVNGPLRQLFIRTGPGFNHWSTKTLSINEIKPFQVVIEVTKGADPNGVLAIDDTLFSPECQDFNGTFPVYTHTIPTRPHTVCPDGGVQCPGSVTCISQLQICDFINQCGDGSDEVDCASCDFEAGTCGWTDNSGGSFTWAQVSTTSLLNLKGPSKDHTQAGVLSQHYMLLTHSVYSQQLTSVVTSVAMGTASPQCALSFWVYASDVDASTALSLQLQSFDANHALESDKSPMYMSEFRHLTPVGTWAQINATVGYQPHGFKLLFEAQFLAPHTVLAIDDVTLSSHCAVGTPKQVCSGGEHQCTASKVCVDSHALCDVHEDCGDGSDEADCGSFHICDFELGLCDMRPDDAADIKWLVSTPQDLAVTEEAPTRDHSLFKKSGHILYLADPALKNISNNAKARLQTSVVFPNTYGENCNLRFFYYQNSHRAGSLNVYVQYLEDGELHIKWSSQGATDNQWKKADIQLNENQMYRIVIEGIVGALNMKGFYSSVSVDDVSLTPDCRLAGSSFVLPDAHPTPDPGNCPVGYFPCDSMCHSNSEMCDMTPQCHDGTDERDCPNACDFEQGTCGWTDPSKEITSATFSVIGISPRQFPTDHNPGSIKGHALSANITSDNTVTSVMSPLFFKAADGCTFSFWFWEQHSISDLSLKYISGGAILATLWNKPQLNYPQSAWHNIAVPLPLCASRFQLSFDSKSKDYFKTGTISLDDFKFENCSLPSPLDHCMAGQFLCEDKQKCIASDLKCDLNRDCCDGSDEDPFLCYSFREFTFEWGMSGWQQTTDDDGKWELVQPSVIISHTEYLPDHSVPDGGHYVISSQAYSGYKSRLTHAMNQPGQDCHVRLWYSSLGSYSGLLNVYIREPLATPLKLLKSVTLGPRAWQRLDVSIQTSTGYQLVLEAVQGVYYNGGVVVDDVTFSPGCNMGSPTPPPSFVTSSSNSSRDNVTGSLTATDVNPIGTASGSTATAKISTSSIKSTSATENQTELNNSKDDSSGSWKLPVGIAVGLLFLIIIAASLVLYIRHTRTMGFKKLKENETEQSSVVNPAFELVPAASERGIGTANETNDFNGLQSVVTDLTVERINKNISADAPFYQDASIL